MKLIKIDTGNFMVDGGALFGVIPKAMWQSKYPVDNDNYCNLSMRCLLVDTGDRKILIDTGAGAKQSDKFFSWHRLNGNDSLLKSLSNNGYHPDDISDVILTHLHWDHCGGCVYYDDDNMPQVTFKNATHWVSASQWANYEQPNSREGVVYFPENMRPVYDAGLLQLVDNNEEILPGIEVRLLNGHTQGNLLPIVHTPYGAIAFMGDLIPVAPSVRTPWVAAYDTQPLISIEEKRLFLQEALEKDITLFFEHDLYTECCSLVQTDKGIAINDVFTLNEFIREQP
ncbi:MBL fold metallo-hydrolase [Carboxylicivirga sp. M1479]|uniref:MBL fold metallo-hydrolase n=1 Tax=Carboxylicivirga sp. M1479 TaxID=2594476 RepID=UPI00163D93EA|nr:MBL fold metallo-hydrolase [Carboxylicivirga sp. M1479]